MNKVAYNIVLIGAKSTGKTVYLTALYLLPFIRVTDEETLKYLKPLKQQFEKREIQATNAGYQELFFEYKKDDFNLRFQIDDYDGKFAEQFSSDENKELKKKLEKNIQKAEGMMFFLPYEENLDIQKAENIREEIDLFIEKVKELYPNRKELPIPVVIAVTKWDKSPDFKASNENEKAKEYIESNEILKNIKDKIENFFSNVTLIPVSSYKKYNLEKPLEFCFSKTFQEWEKRIEQLKNNKYKLLCFLNKIKDDIKFFKDGKYIKLYESLEKDIFEELFNKFKSAKNIDDFEKINNEYKLDNGEFIIDCLKKSHKAEILKLKENLLSNKKKQNIKIALIGVGVFVAIGAGIYIYQQNKNKNILYSEIVTNFKSGNFSNTLELIDKYKSKFGKGDKNYKEVIKIENEVYSKCKNDTNEKLEKLKNLTSLNKQIEILNLIKKEAKSCNISLPNMANLNKLYEDYNMLLELINQISVDNMEDELISQIATLLTEIKNYDEYNNVYSLLNKKIESISEVLLNSNNAEDGDKILKLLNFISQLNINNPELVEKLNKKYSELKNILAYENFKDELDNLDYPQAIQYVSDNYQSVFDFKKNEINQILQNKLNTYVSNIIETAPTAINSESDLNALKQKIDAINNILNQTIEIINYSPTLDNPLQEKFNELKNLYNKYNGDATVRYIAFKADNEENEPLGFKCESLGINHDNNIILSIGYKTYRWDEGSNCSGLTISWNVNDYYNEGNYDVTIIEKDTLSKDDVYTSYVTLDRNDIINLINGETIDKSIGNGYHIIFGGAQ